MKTLQQLKDEIEKEHELFCKYWAPYNLPMAEASKVFAHRIALAVGEYFVGEEKEPTKDDVKITRYRGYSQGRNNRIIEECQLLEDLKNL